VDCALYQVNNSDMRGARHELRKTEYGLTSSEPPQHPFASSRIERQWLAALALPALPKVGARN